jgi:membrane associated rhomboid family serine protease
MSLLIPIRDLNPHRRFPVITLLLIAANVVAFFATSKSIFAGIAPEAAFHYGAIPCDVLGRCAQLSQELDQEFGGRSPFISLFTSMFMHADILHIGFNMLFLWVFGNNVEDRLGRIRFPIFYVVTGLAASFAQILVSPDAPVPTIGASGAISGLLGAYVLLWPRATIISLVPLGFFFFSVRTPAWVSLGLWFVVQVFGGLAGLGLTEKTGGVAFLAHVGGFVAGMLLIVPFGGRRIEPHGRLVDDPYG